MRHAWIFALVVVQGAVQGAAQSGAQTPSPRDLLDHYCVTCHNQKLHTAGLAFETLDTTHPAANAETIERIIAKLRAGSMPPPGLPRPAPAAYQSVAAALENQIDRAWLANPHPGKVNSIHRLNRAEYNNTIRDLFSLDLDVKPLLPGDETADGSFDNFADSLSISTAHIERYVSVARQVTRLAVGIPPANPTLDTFPIPLHVLQNDRQSEDLPLGSRGGIAVHYNFPADGQYLIKVRLQRQYQDYLKGMGWPQQLDVRLDGKLLQRFTVGGGAKGRPAATSWAGSGEPGFAGDPEWEKYMQVTGDAGLELRIPVAAGPHIVGVSFVRELWEPEGLPQPLQRGRVIADDQVYMDYANVASLQIGGPYPPTGPAKDTPTGSAKDTGPASGAPSRRAQDTPSRPDKDTPSRPDKDTPSRPDKDTPTGSAQDTPSRRAIFICTTQDRACATKILARLARLAYRRPVTPSDLTTLLTFFDQGFDQGRRAAGSFDNGIQFALERLLSDPDFLLRIHRDPPTPGVHPLPDLELASQLSFFLWSSIPDDRLLSLAEHHQLSNPRVLAAEVRRMLADPRAIDALVNNFAAQWLNLRRVGEVVVDPERYPNYDESLLQAFQRETELFVASTLREDRSVNDLLDADYTFVNERLARHYGIPGVYGSRFRRVTLPNHDERGGLLAEGALLATTSYPNRTSPVLRGKFLLNNIFDWPIPPPPPGVNTNIDNQPGAKNQTMRERLARHRQNATCNSCHSIIDPLGFALENFDVIGGWRTVDETGKPVDAAGSTVSGARIEGLAGLRALLLADREQFPRTLTGKLLSYALGRKLAWYDQPAVRQIVRDAAPREYRWSSLILGIVQSPAFLQSTCRESQTASN